MPGGPLEERLREWVKARVKRERGLASRLAEYLDRHPSWVTMYTASSVDADLDTSVQIAAFFRIPLETLIGQGPLVSDEETAAQTRALEQIRELLQTIPLPTRPPDTAQADAPTPVHAAASHTKPRASLRRSSATRRTGT